MTAGASDTPALLDTARSHAESGSFAEIVRLLEKTPREELLAEPELGYHLAYAWRRTGDTADALRLCQDIDIPARRSAAEWLIRRRLNLEAMLRFDRGEIPAADQLWSTVVEYASAANDHALLSAAHNNLGIVYTLQDRVDAALAAYNRALLAAQQRGDRRGVAQSHQNLAILLREMGRPLDADAHFGHALREARIAASDDVRGRVEEERALLLLDFGDVVLAEATAQRALSILTGIGDAGGEGEALRVLGIIALRKRSNESARAHLMRARELAARINNALLEAETLEALAVLENAEGSPSAARAHEEEAASQFRTMHAEPWGRRIRTRTAALAGFR